MKKIVPSLLSIVIFLEAQELPTNIENLTRNLDVEQIASQLDQQSFNQSDDSNDDDQVRETLATINIDDTGIFGFNFIKTAPTSINTTSDLPVPNDYVISLRDEISIILSGSMDRRFNLDVELDGSILFPEIGSIQVAGDTYDELKERLKKIVEKTYVGVKIDISLKSLSARKISIVGAINNPGTYLVNPFTTISGALAYSGGIKRYASLRKIKVIRGSDEIYFDLYDLLINGNRSNDISIQQGDVIMVESTNNFIEIKGEVNRPMIYEYLDNESIKDLVRFSMGFTPDANQNKINLIDVDEENNFLKSKEINLGENPSFLSFDKPKLIEVFPIAKSPDLQIKVLGPLENSGYFDYEDNANLKDLLSKVEFSSYLNPFIGVVENGNFSKLFSLNDPSTWDIDLLANSSVYFFSFFDSPASDSRLSPNSSRLISDYILKIQYRKETINFPIFGKFAVEDIVDYLGLDMSDTEVNKTRYIAPLEDLVVVGSFKEMIFESKKFHALSFRFLDREPINVEVVGEVELPGNYIVNSNTTLGQLYDLVGGLRETADKDVVVFSRNSVKLKNQTALKKARDELNEFLIANLQEGENINPTILALAEESISDDSLGRISGDFSFDSEIIDEFILQEGDRITIPKRILSVSVYGEVLSPTTILHDGKLKLYEYIKKAGGYKDFALKKSIYVIRANGDIELSKKGLFRRNLEIYPGDSIIVPRDITIKDDWRSVLIPITQILSNLAFASASLNILENNN